MKIYATREHEFCYGHRVVNHESKCKHFHGHNGKFAFTCGAEQLDDIGRVIDFSAIKELLCKWVEKNWDHKFLLWDQDPLYSEVRFLVEGITPVPFNPTAENMCAHMLHDIGPVLLAGTGVVLTKVQMYETSKCSAVAVI